MARQRKEINWDVVEKLMESGCNGIQIAGKFRIQDDTFYRRFHEEYGCRFQDYKGIGYSAGEADLMAMLHAKALNNSAPGNSHVLIFLAKTRLGMREQEINNLTAPNQSSIDILHENILLKAELDTLKEKLNAYQPQAE